MHSLILGIPPITTRSELDLNFQACPFVFRSRCYCLIGGFFIWQRVVI